MQPTKKIAFTLDELRLRTFDSAPEDTAGASGTVHAHFCTDPCSTCSACTNCSGCSNCSGCTSCSGPTNCGQYTSGCTWYTSVKYI